MHKIFVILLFYSASLKAELTEAQRKKALAPHFKPVFDTFITLSDEDLRNFNPKTSKQLPKGYIRVSPPRGRCWTIQMNDRAEDAIVCKPETLSFTLDQLDKKGNLNWVLVTDAPQDFGQLLVWHTKYRVARVVRSDMTWPGPSYTLPVLSCEAKRSSTGRRVYIHLLNGETWALALPLKDQLVEQPPPPPNLLIVEQDRGSFTKVKKEEKKAEGDADKAAAEKAKAEELKKEKIAQLEAQKKASWELRPRGTATMSGAGFSSGESVAPGINGECHYQYEYPHDPAAGAVECHEVAGFHWLLIPLTCLPELR